MFYLFMSYLMMVLSYIKLIRANWCQCIYYTTLFIYLKYLQIHLLPSISGPKMDCYSVFFFYKTSIITSITIKTNLKTAYVPFSLAEVNRILEQQEKSILHRCCPICSNYKYRNYRFQPPQTSHQR